MNMHWNLLFGLFVVTAAANTMNDQRSNDEKVLSKELEKEWKTFKMKYDKKYKSAAEETRRKQIFSENLDEIEAHNLLYKKGQTSFELGINPFTDMETKEFVELMTGSIPDDPPEEQDTSNTFDLDANAPPPNEIDWRTNGYVTPVKCQRMDHPERSCKSCWAFSIAGALEGQHFRTTGQLVSLSAQQLVDCTMDNYGCAGGSRFRAIRYLISNGGIATEAAYPYEARNGTCRYNPSTSATKCVGFVRIRPRTEDRLEEYVGKVGPISVDINANLSTFKQFKGGIYDDPACTDASRNHAVLVVGYGKAPSGKEYWIVKNSWGTGWANNGYILMARNKNNQCGIASVGFYPQV